MASPDLATLGLRVESTGAITNLRQFDAALNKTSQASDATTSKLRRQDEWLRKVAESNMLASQRHSQGAAAIIRANGGYERFAQIQRQIAEEMRVADQVAVQHAATTDRLTTSQTQATLGSGRLRGGLASLASQVVGLNPQIGQLAGLLASFAVGTALTGGVLLGLVAIAAAYGKLTEKTRKLKEETKEAIERLKELQRLAPEVQLSVDIGKAKDERSSLQGTVDRFGKGSFLGNLLNPVAGALAEKQIKDIRGEIESLNETIKIGEDEEGLTNIKRRLAEQMSSWELEKDGAEARKRYAAEAKKAEDEQLARLSQRIALLSKIKIEFGGNQGALDRIGQGEIKLPFETTPSKTPFQDKSDADHWEKYWAEKFRNEAFARRDAWAKTEKNVLTFGTVAAKAAQTISQSIEYWVVSKLGGGTAGGSLGAGIGKSLATGASAFGSAALGGAIFGPILAGLGAALGKVFGGLFGSSSADREKERQQKASLIDLAATMEILRLKTAGVNVELLEAIEANRKYFEALKLQINDALPGRKNEGERNRQRAEADAMRAQEEQRIRADYERAQRERKEDLEVRLLRAQGKDSEAERLALQLQQQREYEEAMKAGADAATLALLAQVHAAEKVKEALGGLETAVRNAPSGFKIESYINRFAASRPWGPPLGMPYSPDRPSMPYPKGGVTSGGTTVNIGTVTLAIPKGMAPEKVGPAFMKFLEGVRSRTVGPNVPMADALDWA